MSIQTTYRTIGAIKGTNTLSIRSRADGLSVAEALLSSHTTGVPVVNDRGEYVGFISEFDLLKVIEEGKELKTLTAEEIMARNLHAVHEETPIEVAVRYMEQHHLLQLPVVKGRRLVTTVSRHDLLRALLDAGLGVEQ